MIPPYLNDDIPYVGIDRHLVGIVYAGPAYAGWDYKVVDEGNDGKVVASGTLNAGGESEDKHGESDWFDAGILSREINHTIAIYLANGDSSYTDPNFAEVDFNQDGSAFDVAADTDVYLGGGFRNITLLGNYSRVAMGNQHSNVITGNSAGNMLYGEGGDDVLIGGGGPDTLDGQAGSDTFVYKSVSDSPRGIGSRDYITHFDDARDKDVRADDHDHIDLTAIVLPTGAELHFIGHDHYDGEAGAIRWIEKTGYAGAHYAVIAIDVDGDGQSDMQMEVIGHHHLTAADFGLV